MSKSTSCIPKMTILSLAMGAAGCASYLSTPQPQSQGLKDGLVYYLPKRPIIVQATIPAPKSADAAASDNGSADQQAAAAAPAGKGAKKAKKAKAPAASPSDDTSPKPGEQISIVTAAAMPDFQKRFVLTDEDNSEAGTIRGMDFSLTP